MNKRPIEATRNDERRAWELRCQCWTIRRIADELGLDESTVGKMLKRKEKALAAEFREEAEEIKARQTEQLALIAEQALAAWERSQQDAISETTKSGLFTVNKTTGEVIACPEQVSVTRAGQSGNPALLAQAMKALADARAIWGLDAPKKSEVAATGEVQKVYVVFDPEEHI
jgi:hypothetical protein